MGKRIILERKLVYLLLVFATLTLVSSITVVGPLSGLSMILGSSVLGSSVLGSSVLGSSVLGSSGMGTTTTTIVEAYTEAVSLSQLYMSLVAIGLLIYTELTDPSYTGEEGFLSELRRGWMPVLAILVFLFFIVVAVKVWLIVG